LTKDSQIGLLILLGLLMAASYAPQIVNRKTPPPPTKIAFPDFPPVDGAGRPAIWDEK
jgi:hypothetical protein